MSPVLLSVLLNLGVVSSPECVQPRVYNVSEDPWNEIDQRNLESAMVRCGEKFERSPCLKKFTKRDVRVYWAICGGKK